MARETILWRLNFAIGDPFPVTNYFSKVCENQVDQPMPIVSKKDTSKDIYPVTKAYIKGSMTLLWVFNIRRVDNFVQFELVSFARRNKNEVLVTLLKLDKV